MINSSLFRTIKSKFETGLLTSSGLSIKNQDTTFIQQQTLIASHEKVRLNPPLMFIYQHKIHK
jgi:hypothetical protein